MNEILMRIIIQNVVFLELSSGDMVNPDAAVQELETIDSELAELSDEDKSKFIAYVRLYADSEQETQMREARLEFIKSIPEAFGLIDEQD